MQGDGSTTVRSPPTRRDADRDFGFDSARRGAGQPDRRGDCVARGRQQQAIDRRELAVAEAGNLMEQLTSFSWNDLTRERLDRLMRSDNLRQSIPAAVLDVKVEPSADKPEAKRIGIKIEYPVRRGRCCARSA